MTVEMLTTVVATASTYNLVDLDTVKAEIAIDPTDTTKDDWLNRSIGQVSRSIRSYCNRVFQQELIRDIAYIQQDPYPYQTPGGVSPLQLSRYPIALLAILTLATAAKIGDTLLDFGSGAGSAGIVSGPGLKPGTTAGFVGPTLTLNTPVAAPMAAGTPIAFGMEVLQTTALSAGVPTQQVLAANVDYAVDKDRGHLLRLNPFTGVVVKWEAVPTTINYWAGYQDVPDDVVVAALRWMVLRWSERSRDPMLKAVQQPLVGTQSYWVGGPPRSGGVPAEIADLLQNYRVPVVC